MFLDVGDVSEVGFVVLYVMVTVAIVISLQAVGNILVLALLITPAATARMLTERLRRMTLLAAGLAATGAVVGLYVSYYADLAAGGLIVMVLTAVVLLTWLIAPRHGGFARVLAGRDGRWPLES